MPKKKTKSTKKKLINKLSNQSKIIKKEPEKSDEFFKNSEIESKSSSSNLDLDLEEYDLNNPELEGHFMFFDNPIKITFCSIIEKEIYLNVEWLVRKNGIKPRNTIFSSSILRKYDPDLLINFYESKIKIVSEEEK